MAQQHGFFSEEVKLGRKGQLTIPKKLREEDGLKENDVFRLTHFSGGSIVLEKKKKNIPEIALFEFLDTIQKIDWRKAWEEVKAERKIERN